MSIKRNLVAVVAAICLFATASENVEAQIFRTNNGYTCQPARIIRPVCAAYYPQPQFQACAPVQAYVPPQSANQVQPIYSASQAAVCYGPSMVNDNIVSDNSFDEMVIGQSPITIPTSVDSTSTINRIFDAPVVADDTAQPSASDGPTDNALTQATPVDPAPTVEPVPDSNPTILTPTAEPVTASVDENSSAVEIVPATDPPSVESPSSEPAAAPQTEPTPAEKSILNENL